MAGRGWVEAEGMDWAAGVARGWVAVAGERGTEEGAERGWAVGALAAADSAAAGSVEEGLEADCMGTNRDRSSVVGAA